MTSKSSTDCTGSLSGRKNTQGAFINGVLVGVSLCLLILNLFITILGASLISLSLAWLAAWIVVIFFYLINKILAMDWLG